MMAAVHPSRMGLIPPASRPRASDLNAYDSDERHGREEDRRGQNGHSRDRSPARGRRSSPTYESYTEVEARRQREEEQSAARRAEMRDQDRERQRELNRLTPDGEPAKQAWSRSDVGGRGSYFDQRRDQRSRASGNLWARSPSPPRPSDAKKRHRSSKHVVSPAPSDDSEEERRRRRKRRQRKREERRRSRSASPRRARSDEAEEAEWIERPAAVAEIEPTSPLRTLSDDDDIGPQPLLQTHGKMSEREYGGALLRGEGTAMAAFVAEGARIPRRGEIGLESQQIEAYESAGFVMSGSRHRRMNAVRLRKENQVISAEEKRSLLNLQAEEKAKREADIISDFRELVDTKLRAHQT